MDCTLILGVDRKHIEQLALVVPTWFRFKQEIFQWPLIVFHDKSELGQSDVQKVIKGFSQTWDDALLVGWPPLDLQYESQRAKMLAGHVHVPMFATTTWVAKIDTDAMAYSHSDWLDERRFAPLADDRKPMCVCPSWSYTKACYGTPQQFDAWAATHPRLKHLAPLNIPAEPGARRIRHKRFCSWVSFFRTMWLKESGQLCDYGKLPIPSHDGYLSMLVAMRGVPWRHYPAKNVGWTNTRKIDNIKSTVQQILNGTFPPMRSECLS